MPAAFDVRLKPAALENLKGARDRVRTLLGTSKVGARLTGLDEKRAGELANALLELLDGVDAVVSRAKPVD